MAAAVTGAKVLLDAAGRGLLQNSLLKTPLQQNSRPQNVRSQNVQLQNSRLEVQNSAAVFPAESPTEELRVNSVHRRVLRVKKPPVRK